MTHAEPVLERFPLVRLSALWSWHSQRGYPLKPTVPLRHRRPKPASPLMRSPKALQQRYQGISDFTADFSQSYRGGVLSARDRRAGHGFGKETRADAMGIRQARKEGVRLRRTKDRISTSRRTGRWWSRRRHGRRLHLVALSRRERATSPGILPPCHVDSPVPGTLALKLTPRRRQPDYDYLVVAVDPVSLQIRGLVTRDAQGGDSTLTFTNLKENQRISDKVFAFRIPRGVDVVNNAARN